MRQQHTNAPLPSGSVSSTALRRATASDALAKLGSHRSEDQVLSIQCHDGHHVAAVFRTDAGAVFVSRTGPHGHGSRDFVDTPHHGGPHHRGRGGEEFVDLVDAGRAADDELPAWCDCGPWTLSRSDVREHLRSRRRTVHLP